MINNLHCIKGLVTGSTKKETDLILERILTNSKFEQIITGDNVKKGKPDLQAFNLFLIKTGLKPEEVIVVENSPLGVQAARNSKMRCVLTLNNSPLGPSEFKDLINKEDIFENTYSVYNCLRGWCNNENSKQISPIKAKYAQLFGQ